MRFIYLFVLCLSAAIRCFATSFSPLSLDTQLRYSHGVIEGKLLSMDYKQIRNSEVVTQYIFSVDKFAGLGRNEILNKNNFPLLVPGGVWQGEIYDIPNAPVFKVGQSVILIVQRGEQGFYLENMGMSKYLLVEEYGERYLVSDFYQQEQFEAKISYEDFVRNVEKVFPAGFLSFQNGKTVYLTKMSEAITNRSIAANDSHNEGKVNVSELNTNNMIGIFWLLFLFAAMGSVYIFLKKK